MDLFEEYPEAAEEYQIFAEMMRKSEEAGNSISKTAGSDNSTPKRELAQDYEFHNETIDSLFHISGMSFRQLYLIQKTLKEMTVRGPKLNSQMVNTVISGTDQILLSTDCFKWDRIKLHSKRKEHKGIYWIDLIWKRTWLGK